MKEYSLKAIKWGVLRKYDAKRRVKIKCVVLFGPIRPIKVKNSEILLRLTTRRFISDLKWVCWMNSYYWSISVRWGRGGAGSTVFTCRLSHAVHISSIYLNCRVTPNTWAALLPLSRAKSFPQVSSSQDARLYEKMGENMNKGDEKRGGNINKGDEKRGEGACFFLNWSV